MRSAAHGLLLALCLAVPGVAGAKRPEPVDCPTDTDVVGAVAAACPCDGELQPDTTVLPWRNHGQYVRCVTHMRNAYRKAGCLTDDLKRTMTRCAARSSCGKEGAVLCCTYDLGTCSDPAPGDATMAGVCSNDGAVACDVAADCTKSSGKVARSSEACVERGGVDVGSGGVCTPCPPPVQ
jgi:hypothetical protein